MVLGAGTAPPASGVRTRAGRLGRKSWGRRCHRDRRQRRLVPARTPPPRAPVPFEKQLAAIQENGGRPLARADIAKLQPATPAAPVRLITATKPEPPARARSTAPAHPAGAGTMSLSDRERRLQS